MPDLCWKSELLTIARRFADRVAVHDLDGTCSYGALFDHAAGIAGQLLAAGAGPGRVVGTFFANSRRAVAASYATILSGACEAPVNANLAASDARSCIARAGVEIVLTDKAGTARLGNPGARVMLVEDIPAIPLDDLQPVPVAPTNWARIVFTSGTTGIPKGIVHSQIGRWTGNLLLRATLPEAPAGRNVLLLTPFSHGASLLTFAFLDGGGSVTLLDGLDVAEVVSRLEAGSIDQIFAPPTVLAKLLPALSDRQILGIEAIFCGTAPLPPELYARARAVFGPVVRITYGKSEVFNPITVLTPEETDAWYAEGRSETVCVGWPAAGVEIRIDEDKRLGDGGAGQGPGPVLIRARHMLVGTLGDNGYEPHGADEFHHTGDIGFVDEQGRLHLCGREADVIKSGGYRITPEEIEAALRPALPSGEIVVLGLPSSYWGEVIAAVAAAESQGWVEALQPTMSAMSGFKRPKLFVTLGELPRNALGKISRTAVRKAILDLYTIEDGPRPALKRRTGA